MNSISEYPYNRNKKMEAVAAKSIICSVLVFFSWSHSNIGDIGITPGMIHLLEQNIPGAEITICANSRAEATREYLTSRFPKCKVVETPFRGTEPTPEFREALITDMHNKARVGELTHRVRGLQAIPGEGFSERRVDIVSDREWRVWLDLELSESV